MRDSHPPTALYLTTMAKYSFKEECDNLDKLAREMRKRLQEDDTINLFDTVWDIAALAERMKRKLCKYHIPGVKPLFRKKRNLLDNDCGR